MNLHFRSKTHVNKSETLSDARNEVIGDIEMFYHSKRLHSYVAYVSAHDFERLSMVS